LLLFGFNQLRTMGPFGDFTLAEVTGLGALAVAVMILMLTVRIWARWAPAAALFAGIKTVIALISGSTLSPPFRPYPRILAAEAAVYCVVAVVLLLRYGSHEPTLFDRVILVFFVLAVCSEMAFEPSRLPLLIGLSALLVSWLLNRFVRPAGANRRTET
jgi:hypothetical protein